MSSDPPRMRDAYRYNDTSNALELATAERRFEQLIDQREKLIERSRFGIFALNGASTIGILSNLKEFSDFAGADPKIGLAFFIIGMLLSLISIQTDTIHVGSRAAQMFVHLSLLRSMRATLDDHLTQSNEEKFRAELDEMQQRLARTDAAKLTLDSDTPQSPTDFAYSPVALTTLSLAGWSWAAGSVALLFAIF